MNRLACLRTRSSIRTRARSHVSDLVYNLHYPRPCSRARRIPSSLSALIGALAERTLEHTRSSTTIHRVLHAPRFYARSIIGPRTRSQPFTESSPVPPPLVPSSITDPVFVHSQPRSTSIQIEIVLSPSLCLS